MCAARQREGKCCQDQYYWPIETWLAAMFLRVMDRVVSSCATPRREGSNPAGPYSMLRRADAEHFFALGQVLISSF